MIGIAMIIQIQNNKNKPYASDHSPWSPDPAVNNDFIGHRDAPKDANNLKVPYNDPNKPICKELQKRIDDINKELRMRENFNKKWYAGLFNGGHATRVERLTSERDKLVARKNRGDCKPWP